MKNVANFIAKLVVCCNLVNWKVPKRKEVLQWRICLSVNDGNTICNPHEIVASEKKISVI